MPKIEFGRDQYLQMRHLLNAIDLKVPNSSVTVVIDKTHCTLIGGQGVELEMVRFALDADWDLKVGQWSLCASSVQSFWQHAPVGYPVCLAVEYEGKSPYPQVDVLMKHASRLYIQSRAVVDAHVDFIATLTSAPYQVFSTRSAMNVITLSESHKPLDAIEINKETQQVRIERDGEINVYALPQNIELNHNVLFNHESVLALAHLCERTKAKELRIYMTNEQVTFSDGMHAVSRSVASLRDYYKKKVRNDTTEVKLVLDIQQLKKDLDLYLQITPLKKANEALLYITEDSVMLASLQDETGSNRLLHSTFIQCSKPALYQINLSEISKIKIKDITKSHQVKVEVLHDGHNGRKLAFYSDKGQVHPYVTITDIQEMSAKLQMMIDAKTRLQTLLNLQKAQGGAATQQHDMFGFDNV